MEIFKLFGSIFVDSSAAEKSIANASSKAGTLANKFGSVVKSAAKVGAGIATAGAAGAAALFKLAKDAAETADNIDKMSQKIGISAEAYQEFDYVAQLTGTDVDLMKNGMKELRSEISDNSDAFKQLKVSLTDSNGHMKDQETIMWETLNALQGVSNETKKAQLATELFGKAGTDLMPMLNGASGSIDEMRQEAHDLGLVMSDESVSAGAQFNDALTKVQDAFGAIVTKVGLEVMPIFQKLLDWIIEHIPEIEEWFSNLKEFATPIFETIGELIGAIVDAFVKLRETAETEGTTLNLIWTGMQTAFSTAWDVIKGIIDTLIALLHGDFKGAWEAAWNTVETYVSGVWNAIQLYFGAVKQFISDVFNWFKDTAVGQIFGSAVNSVIGFAQDVYNGVTGIFQDIVDFVNSVVDTIQSAWEAVTTVYVPDIEEAHAEAAWGDGGSFGYDPIFHDSAMDNGILLNGATVFGVNGNRPLVGGETGQEMIIGTNSLFNAISQASGATYLADQFEKLFDILEEYFPRMSDQNIVLDTGALVGGTVDRMKTEIDRRYRREKW